ncbi:MAG: serine/threonine-protein kinase, partial [Pseudomonadota bacterium]
MSAEKTEPPGRDPDPEADEDKTILAPHLADEAADEDRTIIASQPGTEDDERTILTGSTGAPAEDDGEKTVITTGAPVDPDKTVIAPRVPLDPADDPDRTIIAPGPPAGPPADPDATIVASVTRPGDPDATIVTTATGGPTYTNTYVPPPPGTPPAPLSSIEAGTMIGGQYRVDAQLDQGGMGRVYRGWDVHTEADVAIKVILPEMAEDTKVADMFRREAKTLRQLHHDAIVRFFNYIPPNRDLNLHALVMGYIEGQKLSDKLKQEGPLSHGDAIALSRRLAEGLEKAHDLEIVHRDLSPDNVMLPGGDIMKAVLIDFGISRSEKIKDVTLGNEFAGKLKYVSPEQLGAYGNDARRTSDVYSLALLMIAMLNGKPLAMGDTIVEAVQMRQDVPDLSSVPLDFQDLLGRMLVPDPAGRVQSMADVAEELRIMVEGETTFSPAKDNIVEGLQAVPMAATATSGATVDMPDTPAVPQGRSRGFGLVLGVAILAGLGIGGYLYSSGAFDGPEVVEPRTPEDGLVRAEGTRATFLAEALPEGCAFATLRRQGPQAGLIEGYAAESALLGGVGQRFGAAFGGAPDVVERQVPPVHCPALELVRALQGTSGAGLEMALDAHELPAGGSVAGRLVG